MGKNSSLSSDVDFIKEFEELKLKQRILIETLNRKNKEQDVFGELNKKLDYLVQDSKQKQESEESQKKQEESQNKEVLEKLDFLVKIFKEAEQSSSDFNEKEYLDSMSNKLDQQFQDISQRLDALEKKVGTSTKGESSEKDDSSNVSQGSRDQVTTQQPSSNGQVANEGSSVANSNTKNVNGTQNSSNADSTAQQQTNPNKTVTPKKNPGKGTGTTSSGESDSVNKQDTGSQEKKDSSTAGSTRSQVPPPPPEFSVDENKVEGLAKEDSKKKSRWRLFS